MELVKRLVGSVYKNNLSVSIEYHGGGYFVRKKVSYLYFRNDKEAKILVREEGLNPNDDNQKLLLQNLRLGQDSRTLSITNSSKESFITLLGDPKLHHYYCVPSIFSESASEKEITEILIDDRLENSQKCYHLICKLEF